MLIQRMRCEEGCRSNPNQPDKGLFCARKLLVPADKTTPPRKKKKVAWFAVGCYYLLIQKPEEARRYLRYEAECRSKA